MSTDLGSILREISSAVASADYLRANSLALDAIADGHAHPSLFNAQAMWHEREGRDQEALRLFESAEQLAPSDVTILNAKGLCLARLGCLDDAIASFDKAIAESPNSA